MRLATLLQLVLLAGVAWCEVPASDPAVEAKQYFRNAKVWANARACVANLKVYAGASEMYRLDKNIEPPASTVDELGDLLMSGGYISVKKTVCPANAGRPYEIDRGDSEHGPMSVRCPIHGTTMVARYPRLLFSLEQSRKLLAENPVVRSLMPPGEVPFREKSVDTSCHMITRSLEWLIQGCSDCPRDGGLDAVIAVLMERKLVIAKQQLSCPYDDAPFQLQADKGKVTCSRHERPW